MILLSIIQKQILSLILIAVFVLLIYLMFKFLKMSLTKTNESKMLSLNLVIRYSQFLKYLEYKESVNEDYSLYMVSINNFTELTNKHQEIIIRSFIRRIVKNLSVMLPYGGKLAQTKERHTFVLYVPKISGNEAEFAMMLQRAVVNHFEYNQAKFFENVSIGYTTTNNNYLKRLEETYIALISSRRNLGTIINYNETLTMPDETHNKIESMIEDSNIVLTKYEVIRTNINKNEGLYLNVTVNNKQFIDYLNEQPIADSSWINMYIINKIMNNLEISSNNNKIYIPVSLATLESDNFIEALNITIQKHNLGFNNIAISIKNSIISKRNNIIKNILQLKEYGVLISFETKIVDNEIYNTIQSYGINTLELYFNGNVVDEKNLMELYNFSKVNQLNTLLISNDDTYQSRCTHHTKEINRNTINEAKQVNKKWSR